MSKPKLTPEEANKLIEALSTTLDRHLKLSESIPEKDDVAVRNKIMDEISKVVNEHLL